MGRREAPRPRSSSEEGRSWRGARHVLVIGLGLLAAALVLAACGGSNPPSSSTSAHVEDAFKFSKCMRENGIKDFPDPKVTPGGGTQLSFKGEGVNQGTMEAAQKACQHFQEEGQGGAELGPREEGEDEKALLKFARCMREHGVEVHAAVSHGGIQVGIRGGPGGKGPNPNSPVLKAAQEACQALLPGSPG
jgi:hypothetical protein